MIVSLLLLAEGVGVGGKVKQEDLVRLSLVGDRRCVWLYFFAGLGLIGNL